MKDKTKVVIRHLPPTLTQSDLFQHIDERFYSRYNWFSFLHGKHSQKKQKYSRAYIDFNHPDDVFEFADFFDGHVFVTEKGVQHKAIVEYAPSQRVPKPFAKKDAREGTIFKDPDYLEFLKLIAKPLEHLPSAEIQLERKEAEQSGSTKETPIITPLMEYVRHKREIGRGNLASSIVAKLSRRSQAASPGKTLSINSKRGCEKKKYIQKDKIASHKEKSTFTLVSRRENQSATASTKSISESETVHSIEGTLSGIPLTDGSGKKKIMLLKGKEREIPHGSDPSSQQQRVRAGGSSRSSTSKQNPRREAGGRLIRSILLDNEPRPSQSVTAPNPKIQILSGQNGKRPPRPGNPTSASNGLVSNHDVSSTISEGDAKRAVDGRYVKKEPQVSGNVGEKVEKRTRNKDRPDRSVWTPLCRSDVSHSGSENLSSTSRSIQSLSDSKEVSNVEMKDDILFGSKGGGLSGSSTGGSSRRPRGDGGHVSEGKSLRRGATGHGAHEKHVWVQKTPSGS